VTPFRNSGLKWYKNQLGFERFFLEKMWHCERLLWISTVLMLSRIPGSVADPGCLSRIRFFPSRIPNPGSKLSPPWIPDPGSALKNLSILTPKILKKWFLSSKMYDPGCASRIRMLTFYPSRIPDPGVKKAPDPGSATLIPGYGSYLIPMQTRIQIRSQSPPQDLHI
jgi:hypothetical protein